MNETTDGDHDGAPAWLLSAPGWACTADAADAGQLVVRLSRALMKAAPAQGDRVAVWQPDAGASARLTWEGEIYAIEVRPTEASVAIRGTLLDGIWDAVELRGYVGLDVLVGSATRDLRRVDGRLLTRIRELDRRGATHRKVPHNAELLEELDRRRSSGTGSRRHDDIPFRFGYEYIPGRGKNWRT